MKDIRDNSVQSVERTINILEELAKHQKGCGVTTLANEVGLHKSTVHRLLGTLMARGYVEKDIETDNYRLGIKLLLLSSAVLERMDVRNIARPYIQELSKQTNENIHLAILDGDEAVYIDKVESPRPNSIRLHSQIGKRIPLHCTAVGKILLSYLDNNQVEYIMSKKGMTKFTQNTIDNLEDYLKELGTVRSQGYAFDEVEHEEGIRCVAAPIYDRKGRVIASISISGATIYINEERMAVLTDEVVKTAMEISYQFGYEKKYF